ncbi:MAG: hypothetical protein GY810_10540 [Aureispira sp.]|nr:hypothetical protein [Aureispira sp.]
MNQNFDFFKTTMPKTRKADYYLGCLNGSVFIDFNCSEDNCIYLCRISFDGYGCCDIDNINKTLNHKDSQKLIEELQKENLDQEAIAFLVKKLIYLNKEHIWDDAIEQYGLIDKE